VALTEDPMECLNCSKWIEVDETYFEINRRPWCGACAKPYIASGLRSAGVWLAKAVLFTVVGASTFALVFSLALGIGGRSTTFLGGAGFVLAFVLRSAPDPRSVAFYIPRAPEPFMTAINASSSSATQSSM
jgi:hypothetical protein